MPESLLHSPAYGSIKNDRFNNNMKYSVRKGKGHPMLFPKAALAALCALSSLVFSNDDKLTVAVYELQTAGDDKATPAMVSERLRAELFNTGMYTVIDRSEMKSILDHQKFQYDTACAEKSCMRIIGQLLGVDRMVFGSLSCTKGLFTIVLQIVNVSTGDLLGIATKDLDTANIKELISDATPALLRKLLQKEQKAFIHIPPFSTTGQLRIESIRTGAAVSIDGKTLTNTSPITLNDLPGGIHSITVKDSLGSGSVSVCLPIDSAITINIPMNEQRHSLAIGSKPAKAAVFLDGKKKLETPLKLDSLIPGQHLLRLEKKGYIPKDTLINLAAGAESLSVHLDSIASISLRVRPDSAAVFINGIFAGRGLVDSYEIASGNTEITLELPGYDPIKENIPVAPGEKKKIEKKMIPDLSPLKITTVPKGASLFLKGHTVGATPVVLPGIIPGNYALVLECPHYETVKEEIQCIKGKAFTKEYKLKLVESYRDSISHQRLTKKGYQRLRRILFSGLSALFVGGGILCNYEAEQYAKKCDETYAEYLKATDNFESYKNRIENDRKYNNTFCLVRNISYGCAGVCVVGFYFSLSF